jgi:hypothetical protein
MIDSSVLFPLLDLEDLDIEGQRLARPLWLEVHHYGLVVHSDDFTQQTCLCVNLLPGFGGLPDHRFELRPIVGYLKVLVWHLDPLRLTDLHAEQLLLKRRDGGLGADLQYDRSKAFVGVDIVFGCDLLRGRVEQFSVWIGRCERYLDASSGFDFQTRGYMGAYEKGRGLAAESRTMQDSQPPVIGDDIDSE